jgi:hypothetical protein
VIATVLATATFLLVVVFLPAQRAGRRQALTFEGVIEKKEIRASESRYGSHLRYVLIIREKSGELVKFQVPQTMYARALRGMPVRKEAGEPLPTIGNR